MADQEDQSLIQAEVDAAIADGEGVDSEPSSPAPDTAGGAAASGNPSQPDTNAVPDSPAEGPQEGGAADAGATTVDPSVGFSQEDIDAVLAGAGEAATAVEEAMEGDVAQAAGDDEEARVDSTGKPFDEIAAAMAAEIEDTARNAPTVDGAAAAPSLDVLGATPLELGEFQEAGESDDLAKGIGLLSDVELQVKIELGRTQKTVEEILALGNGSVVELDRLAGDPVDIFVNERLVARGEVLVLNDNLCIRVSEIISRQT